MRFAVVSADQLSPDLASLTTKTVPISSPISSEVAVILPCYNVEHYLARALDSVFAQTFTDFHIYAVDDGSLDGTIHVLENNAHRCSFITQRHAGAAAARNFAMGMSNSPFVAFLDADDEWLPQKLERQIALLKQDSTLGLACSGCVMNENGGERQADFVQQRLPLSGRLFRKLVKNCFVFTPTVVVRRRCLEEVGLFNESLAVCEDFNLWLRIAARWRIAFLPEVLAITHRRPESLSVSIPPEARLRTGVEALENVRARCPELSPAETTALRHALAERHYFHGSHLLSSGSKLPARRSLTSALKLRATHWRALVRLGLSFLPATSTRSLVDLNRKLARPLRSRNASSI
jgi:glycosyltransferase involved in cell wall biosynthesis